MSDDCRTPKEFFEKLDVVFNFKLDAAASKANAKCKRFFTKKDDALSRHWMVKGNCFLNPPYSKKAGGIYTWLHHAFRQACEGNLEEVVCLIICDVSTKARQLAWEHANEIVELSPRLNFASPGKKNRKGGLQSYQLVIFKAGHHGLSRGKIFSRWNWKDEEYLERSKYIVRG